MAHTIIIAHGRQRDSPLIASAAKELGADVMFTEHRGHAIDIARDVGSAAETLIVAGGDGTLNEVVNGVMMVDQSDRPRLKLLPLGTGNDTSRTLSQKSGWWDVIEATIGEGASRSTRYCVNISDVGLGGAVVQRYTDRLRTLPGQLGYMIAIVRSLLQVKAQNVVVTIDGESRSTRSLMTCVCNGAWFGGAVGIAPDADPSDGVAEVVIVGDVSVLTYARFLPRLKRGK